VWVSRRSGTISAGRFDRWRERIPLVSKNLAEIRAICRQFGIARLELFGSAAGGDFDPNTSDIDVIVDFLDDGSGVSDRYFDLIDALEELLGRPVQAGFARTLKNPYIIAAIKDDRVTLYETDDRSAAA
jgi:predicted nucleotidyltransferase